MVCRIENCNRDTKDEFCTRHLDAFNQLNDAFVSWQDAYGKALSKTDYVTTIAGKPPDGTGTWVVEVAQYLLGKIAEASQ